ncbi:MAG: sigma 54-interacting transcriptional regulator [Thermoguttaceae bacterium]|jgi:DNA-binding NtrC family response regulator
MLTCEIGQAALRPVAPTAAGRGAEAEAPLIAESAAMQAVAALVAKIAPTSAPVLIRGEPGTGKETVARAIHRQSPRADRPFVRVNCGAIRPAELAVTLFGGHEPDAEPWEPPRRGLIELARDGTAFLADVHRLPRWAQARVSALLQENCLGGSGGGRSPPLDVRMVSSTSCNLDAAMGDGRFDGNLYYLLSIITIHVPPLRGRREDIRPLAKRCLAQMLAQQEMGAGGRPHRFTPRAWQRLLNHDWPGNLLELASVVARAVAVSDGPEIGEESLALGSRQAPLRRDDTIAVPVAGSLRQIERAVIEVVIRRYRGNKAAAARALGLHRRQLYRMLQGELPAAADAAADHAGR